MATTRFRYQPHRKRLKIRRFFISKWVSISYFDENWIIALLNGEWWVFLHYYMQDIQVKSTCMA